jgi:aminoglycoside phosphotransferase (APT) family kinase protein
VGDRDRLWIVPTTSPTFTPDLAEQVAHRAAAVAGLDHSDVELIRLGSNAIMLLPGGVVARVARDASWFEVSEREVRAAAALHAAGVPCVRPWPVPQPVDVDGHSVTFWAEIPAPRTAAPIADLGAALGRLHSADVRLDLPPLDPWSHIPERIESAPIGGSARRVLRDVLAEVRDGWADAQFELPQGLIHGDAHGGNLTRGADGRSVLVDLDSVCVGPREWDLAPTGLYATSLAWITQEQYDDFVTAYGGFDVTRAPVFPLLRRMRELRMTAWLAMHAAESPTTCAEFEHRVECLLDPSLSRRWSPR